MVLQEHAMHSIEDPEDMMKHGELLALEIKKNATRSSRFLAF